MADEANPQGMKRPNIPTKKAADKKADRQRIATKKGSKGDRPNIPTKKDSKGDRPSIPTKKKDRPQIPTKGYGNDNEDRPRIPTKKSPYGDRPSIPTKKEDRQERPLIPTKTPPTGPPNFDYRAGAPVSPKGMQKREGYVQESPQSRRMLPSIHTKSRLPNIAVGEGNDPKGMQRPDVPYYQASDPDNFAPFKKGERFDGPPGAGKYTGF
jgi:hypothetical protein